MQARRITTVSDPDFETAWAIYENSFPLFEQRTLEHQAYALLSPACHFTVYREGETFVGFIIYWKIDDYLYIEHYAINPALRGGGYGSRILMELTHSTDRTIILEIDPVTDEISTRRLHFYERLGFVMTPFMHPIHHYREGDEGLDFKLHILSYPKAIDRETYERFNRDLANMVMKRG